MKCLQLILFLLICSVSRAQLQAGFSTTTTRICSGLSVQFQDLSSGGVKQWFWDFGNGDTSSLQNPAVTYAIAGQYTVRLIVRNDSLEDYEQKDNYITVYATPKPSFTVSGINGCVPLNSTFTDKTDFQGASAQSWLWDLKDGTTSTLQNPAHTFTSPGQYDVSLTVATTNGCSATYTRVKAVVSGDKPVTGFVANPLTGCASTLRQFRNQSAGNITSFTWNFGDGGTSNLPEPLYHYKDTGTFTVKLTVSDNGCSSFAERINYIQVTGPVALFTKQINCSNRYVVSYRDTSIDSKGRLWDFGDNTTSTLKAVTHTYSAPGVYVVKLIATGTTCSDTAYDTVRVDVGNPRIEYTPVNAFYCKYTPIQFSVVDYDTGGTRNFAWNFRDGVSTSFSGKFNTISHTYKQAGNFKTEVYLKDNQNCVDTVRITRLIDIKGPVALYDSIATGCSDKRIRLTDRSTEYPNVPITQWLWNFGDGTSSDVQGSTSYEYSFPGTYRINLRVTDADGCYDSITNSIEILQTPTVDAGPDTLVCAGSNIVLNPTGATSYAWKNDAQLSCTNCTNPIASPAGDSAVYYVSGTTNGCSASDSVIIHIQNKQFITVQPNTYAVCQGGSVTLNASGTDDYAWSPAAGLSSTVIHNPVATPAVTTLYTVTGKDSNNCFTDAAAVAVTVNPKPTVNITDSMVQQFLGSSYTITATVSPDATALDWNPKNGLSCYNCLQPVAIVSGSTMYTLTATNQFGCSSSDSIIIVPVCKTQSFYMPNTFSPNNDGMNDYFYPRSGAAFTVNSLVIFNRWGQKLFEKTNFPSNNYSYGWDGKYMNKEQAADVYIYMMELRCTDGKVIIKKGNITLLR